ncbi:MAG: GNAT family N-acetyltransferase [Calditrichaeota bacterium]|nr:GNAT family N-acetyltransferase [Calditrichota bacterium]
MSVQLNKQIIRTTEAFRELKADWHQLLTRIPEHNIFMTWEWMYTWWEVYHARLKNAELRILAYYDQGKLAAVLPYYLYTSHVGPIPLRKMAFLGTQIESSDYLDVISPEDYHPYFRQHLYADLRALAEGADVIEINNCLSESLVFQLFGTPRNGTTFVEPYRVCPYVQLPDSFDAYLKTLSSNFRYNVRRRVRRLLEKEQARLEILDRQEELDTAIKDIFDLHYLRAQQKGLNTKFVREQRLDFHQKMARRLAPRGYIKIFNLIAADGKKIAGLYCFDYNGSLAYFQAGFDPAWSNRSPGTVILAEAIQYAIQQGKSIFDFMRGGEQYKKDWGTVDRYIYLITLPNSFKGQTYLTYYKYRKRMAPVIKKILART